MASLTDKENVFLGKLKTILTSADAAQQAFYTDLYTAVETQMQNGGDSHVSEIFAALQGALDIYRRKADDIMARNRAEAEAAQEELKASKTTKSKAIAGKDEADALVALLNNAITPQKVQEIVDATVDAELTTIPQTSFSLDATVNAHLITDVHKDVSKKQVTGHGTNITEPVHGQGKLKKPFANGKNIHGGHTTFVVRPDMFKNDQVEYDTVDMIAEAWIKKNPNVKELPALTVVDSKGTHEFAAVPLGKNKLNAVRLWIQRANALPRVDGKYCDATHFDNPRIFPGQELALPPGSNDLSPRQIYLKCTTCEVKTNQQEIDVHGGPTVAVTPKSPPPPPEVPPVVVPPKEWTPHEYFRQSSQATDGPIYRPGSMDHALLTLARSGLDETFSKGYFAIRNVTPRMSVKGEKGSGQGIGEDSYLIEGDAPFGNRRSRRDNDYAIRNSHTTGGESWGQRFMTGPRGRVYFPADAEVITQGEELGGYSRYDGQRVEKAHGGHIRMPLFNKVSIRWHNNLGLPYGRSKDIPARQEVLEAETRRWGLSQVDAVLPNVNFIGGDNKFVDVQARISGPFESPDRVYAYMHLLNAQEAFCASMRRMDECDSPADKQRCAETALQAYRDFQENMLVSRADVMRIPMEESGKAIRNYMTSQGVDVAAIDTKLPSLPHLSVVDMPQEQLEQQQDYHKKQDTRYRDIKPGETNVAYSASEEYAYVNQNYFEQECAKGHAVEAHSEREVSDQTRQAFELILKKKESVRSVTNFIATNRNMQIEFGQLLHDMYNHPDNYGLNSQEEASQLIDQLIGDNEAAREQITNQGKTHGGALGIFGTRKLAGYDDPRHMTNPKVLGQAIGANINTNTAVVAEILDRATNTEFGRNNQGGTDGRRFGRAMLHAYGADHSNFEEGELPNGYKNLAATLDPSDEPIVRKAVLDVSVAVEKGAAGRSENAVQKLDNTFADEQHKAQQGDVDLNRTFERTMGGADAHREGLDQIAVKGVVDHQMLVREAIVATGLRHPQFFKELASEVKEMKGTTLNTGIFFNHYGFISRKLRKAGKAADKYEETGNEHQFEKAIRKTVRIFEKLDTKAAQGKDKGAVIGNGMEVVVDMIGNNPELSRMFIETVGNNEELRNAFLKSVWSEGIMKTDGTRPTNHGRRSPEKGRTYPDPNDDHYYDPQFLHDRQTGGRRKKYDVDRGVLHNIVDQDNVLSDGKLDPAQQAAATMLGIKGATANNILGTNPVVYTGTEGQSSGRSSHASGAREEGYNVRSDDYGHGRRRKHKWTDERGNTYVVKNVPQGGSFNAHGSVQEHDVHIDGNGRRVNVNSEATLNASDVRIHGDNNKAKLKLDGNLNLSDIQVDGYGNKVKVKTNDHGMEGGSATRVDNGPTRVTVVDGQIVAVTDKMAKAQAQASAVKMPHVVMAQDGSQLIKDPVICRDAIPANTVNGDYVVKSLEGWLNMTGANKKFPEGTSMTDVAKIMIERQLVVVTEDQVNKTFQVTMKSDVIEAVAGKVNETATGGSVNQTGVTKDNEVDKSKAAELMMASGLIEVYRNPKNMVPVTKSTSVDATLATAQMIGEVDGKNRLSIIAAAALLGFIKIPVPTPGTPVTPPPPPVVPCVGCAPMPLP